MSSKQCATSSVKSVSSVREKTPHELNSVQKGSVKSVSSVREKPPQSERKKLPKVRDIIPLCERKTSPKIYSMITPTLLEELEGW